MEESDVGKVHQVIGDQLIVSARHDCSVDRSIPPTPNAAEVGNQTLIRLLGITPPQPHERVAFNGPVSLQANARRNRTMGVMDAPSCAIELQSVIRTLQAVRLNALATRQRSKSMRADTGQG